MSMSIESYARAERKARRILEVFILSHEPRNLKSHPLSDVLVKRRRDRRTGLVSHQFLGEITCARLDLLVALIKGDIVKSFSRLGWSGSPSDLELLDRIISERLDESGLTVLVAACVANPHCISLNWWSSMLRNHRQRRGNLRWHLSHYFDSPRLDRASDPRSHERVRVIGSPSTEAATPQKGGSLLTV
jgi:hypothetical protein